MGPYRTIFTGVLVQDSAFSVGGNQPHTAVDDPICKDGGDRYTIRGTTLAGALIATAARLFDEVDGSISGKYARRQRGHRNESLWRIFNSHPVASDDGSTPHSELRQGVAIFPETGAAKEDALFDMETLPRGTRWEFCMEVNTAGHNTAEGAPDAEGVAFAALQEWVRGRCWLGRSVARGMGWMHLTDLRVYQLSTEHVDLWPNSEQEPRETLKALQHAEVPCEALLPGTDKLSKDKAWYYVEISCSVRAGDRGADAYGFEALAVGGHAAASLTLKWLQDRYLPVPGMEPAAQNMAFRPDLGIAMSAAAGSQGRNPGDAQWEPFIPGSSIRGTLRHGLSRLNCIEAGTEASDDVDKLFGSMKRSSALLVQDAYLRDEHWTAAWVHHHAEDEFSGGVYSSSKFDRVALLNGEFQFKIVIEAPTDTEALDHFRSLDKVLALARHGRLPLGAGQWRGFGWPVWNIGVPKLCRAGSTVELPWTEDENEVTHGR